MLVCYCRSIRFECGNGSNYRQWGKDGMRAMWMRKNFVIRETPFSASLVILTLLLLWLGRAYIVLRRFPITIVIHSK